MSVFMEIGPPADKQIGMGGTATATPSPERWLSETDYICLQKKAMEKTH